MLAALAGADAAAAAAQPGRSAQPRRPPTRPRRRRTGALYRDGPNDRWLLGGAWLYRADPTDVGVTDGWWRNVAGTDGWSPVTVPNSYNAGDLSSGAA